MEIKNLEKALNSFIIGDIPVSDLACILFRVSDCERIDYQDLASADYAGVDETLLFKNEYNLNHGIDTTFGCREAQPFQFLKHAGLEGFDVSDTFIRSNFYDLTGGI